LIWPEKAANLARVALKVTEKLPAGDPARTDNEKAVMRKYVLTGICLALAAAAPAQVHVSGTLESYFITRYQIPGMSHRLSWGELNIRFSPNVRATFSMTEYPAADTLDEAYVAAESDLGSLRIGRMRTSFGLSDWSELYYNGFNHLPMVSTNALTTGIRLSRDDTGAEATYSLGQTQLQVGLLDTQNTTYQWTPKELRHTSLRVQQTVAGAIVGFDALKSVDGTNDVYGLDVRWGMPHWLVKGQAMQGQGGDSAQGYVLDVAYRPAAMPRSQIVARTERLLRPSKGDLSLHTVGFRQIVNRFLSVNLNYGWATASNSTFTPQGAIKGWSVQTMFQVRF